MYLLVSNQMPKGYGPDARHNAKWVDAMVRPGPDLKGMQSQQGSLLNEPRMKTPAGLMPHTPM